MEEVRCRHRECVCTCVREMCNKQWASNKNLWGQWDFTASSWHFYCKYYPKLTHYIDRPFSASWVDVPQRWSISWSVILSICSLHKFLTLKWTLGKLNYIIVQYMFLAEYHLYFHSITTNIMAKLVTSRDPETPVEFKQTSNLTFESDTNICLQHDQRHIPLFLNQTTYIKKFLSYTGILFFPPMLQQLFVCVLHHVLTTFKG